MAEFDKYEREGAYHWVQTDPKWNNFKYNAPLVARYKVLMKHIPSSLNTALDLGCGDGYLLSLLHQQGCKTAVGIDNVSLGVKLAHQQAQRHNNNAARLVCGSAYHLPFQTHSFDAITMADVIEHLESPEPVLVEAARVLKPKGIMVVSTPNWHPERPIARHHVQEFKPEELYTLLKSYFNRVELTGCWVSWAVNLWKKGGRRRQWINRISQLGFNPLTFSTKNITIHYEQLIAVCQN